MSSQRPEVVVITGASAGVGRATAWEFAKHGARIGLVARDPVRLEAARREVEWLGGKAIALPTDVADADGVERAAQATEAAFGDLDVWVNNAMTTVFSPVKAMEPAEYRRVTEVTYLGYVYGTLAALKRMQPRDRGTIVQVGSALATRSIPLQSAYCAAKHAILGFTESLWTELIHDRSRVHVAIVQMPALNTPQFAWSKSRMPRKAQPVPPIYQPEVAARAIYWAAHHRRRKLWVGMPTVKAMIGERVAPSLLDHYLAAIGYEAQQYDGPEDPNRPANLWATVPGDFSAHGDFSDRSRQHSLQLWLDTHRTATVLAGAGLAGGLVWVARRRAA